MVDSCLGYIPISLLQGFLLSTAKPWSYLFLATNSTAFEEDPKMHENSEDPKMHENSEDPKMHENSEDPKMHENSEDPKMHEIKIADSVFLRVDDQGYIDGPKGEGNNSIVLCALKNKGNKEDNRLALRIPRLLKIDELINFYLVEIAWAERDKSFDIGSTNGVGGATQVIDLNFPRGDLQIPDRKSHNGQGCFLGFYFSPEKSYKVVIVSNEAIWPSSRLSKIIEPKALFSKLSENLPDTRDAFFLPDMAADSGEKDGNPLIRLNRTRLNEIYLKRSIAGWWFNIPLAVHTWFQADLERLLVSLVTLDDQHINSLSACKSWDFKEWFVLCKSLAEGMQIIHRKGYIHGDTRPANIMVENSIEAKNFKWIDFGLGVPDDKVPAPLGGGRESPFYALERLENFEYEDADTVCLDKLDDAVVIQFKYKNLTHSDPQVLPILNRDLGFLELGDRIQIREFILKVNKVDKDNARIIISDIYKIVSDSLLIKIENNEKDDVIELLNDAPIPRYRIYRHWSQATDIYGYGCIVLYVFFMRGLSHYLINRDQSLMLEKDKLFKALIVVLNNRSFLDNFISMIRRYEPFDKDFRVIMAEDDRLKAKDIEGNGINSDYIARHFQSIDYAFSILLLGFNNHSDIFIYTLAFCLKCMWRKDGFHDKLDCYCQSRSFINKPTEQSKPIDRVVKDINYLVNHLLGKDELEKFNGNHDIYVHFSGEGEIGPIAKINEMENIISKKDIRIQEQDKCIEKIKNVLEKSNKFTLIHNGVTKIEDLLKENDVLKEKYESTRNVVSNGLTKVNPLGTVTERPPAKS